MDAKYRIGCCKVPKDIDKLPTLQFANGGFVAPDTVDLRDYCTKTEDQGSTPMCAAYTAAGFAENILWRKTDVPTQIDPVPLYKFAKTIDGDADGDGTTLPAVCDALLYKGYFNADVCKTQIIQFNAEQMIRYAIHKFGCCLGAFNITREWYDCNMENPLITGTVKNETEGGHAVLVCGYTRDYVIIQNSWGVDWGRYGFGFVSWEAFRKQFLYGAVLTNALDGLKIR